MADRYWVGGSGSWNSTAGTKWATTSGGVGGATVPTSADNVFFDANSGVGPVYMSGPLNANNLDYTGFVGEVSQFISVTLNLYGSLTFSSEMTLLPPSTTGILFAFQGTGAHTIDVAGKTLDRVNFANSPPTGTYTLVGDLTVADRIFQLGKRFETAGYDLTCASYTYDGFAGDFRELDLGTSTVTLTGNNLGNAWFIGTSFATTFSGLSATISLAGTVSQNFYSGGQQYGTISVDNPVGVVFNSQPDNSNRFRIVNLTNTVQPTEVSFTAATESVITNFALSGTNTNLVALKSSTPGSAFTLRNANGPVEVSYLNIQDSTVLAEGFGSSSWTAYNSLDSSNNTGWTFIVVPVEVALSGVQATGYVSTDIESIELALSGAQATAQVGNFTPLSASTRDLSGVEAVPLAGLVTASILQSAELSGLQSASQVGSLDNAASNTLFNVAATGQSGPVVASILKTAALSGVQASGQLGTFGVIRGKIIPLSGVQAVGSNGFFDIGWYNISTGQTPDWSGVGTAQDPSWTSV